MPFLHKKIIRLIYVTQIQTIIILSIYVYIDNNLFYWFVRIFYLFYLNSKTGLTFFNYVCFNLLFLKYNYLYCQLKEYIKNKIKKKFVSLYF